MTSKNLSEIVNTYEHLRNATLEPIPSIITAKPLPLPTLQIVFSGTVNSGKSTIINALLGSDILPIASVACTSRITVLRKSTDNKFHIKLKDTSQDFDTPEKLKEELVKIVGEGLETSLSEVVVEWVGSDLLDQGLELVDTPGFNEKKLVCEESLKFMQNASTVVFVINRDDGCLVLENTRALQYLAHFGVIPLFIMNKADEQPDPRLFKTPTQIQKYKEDTKKNIHLVKEGILSIFPKLSFFSLSAFEALDALERNDPYPEPFQKFLVNLGSSLHESLLQVVKKNLSDYTNQVNTLMIEFFNYEQIEKGVNTTQNLISNISAHKERMKQELQFEITKEFDIFIEKNKHTLYTELCSCNIPTTMNNQQALQYMMILFQNKIMNHLKATAINHYKEWHSTFMHSITRLIEDGKSYWDPHAVQVVLSDPVVSNYTGQVNTVGKYTAFAGSLIVCGTVVTTEPNEILIGEVTSNTVVKGALSLATVGLGLYMVSSILSFLSKDIAKNDEHKKKAVTKILEQENLLVLKNRILESFAFACNNESAKIVQSLTTIKTALEDKLSSKKQSIILQNMTEITNSYLTITAAEAVFEFDEPKIESVASENNGGLIYNAIFQNKPFFAQIFDKKDNISNKYLNLLRPYYLIDLPNGKKVVLRESIWVT